ncbi:MAG: CoA transferase [Alphaproteobacteria bacterium]|jgi:crotonobetainyl-CoA:carnitine CoA-transferase CaiB-like acyl-CoA transferase|nr:CoA transferase [Alphaproteobacteria bacterium]
MPSILNGITILDLSTDPAAALSTMMLSDQGARVIRVMAPEGPLFRAGGFIIWDRGKECVALDLDLAGSETPEAARFRELLAGADVLVEDFAPSSERQALIARERLEGINPHLISCSITAYGKRGALKDEPPIEDLVLARMGVLGGLPGFRPAPVHLVHPLPTVGAAILACLGIAAALLAREETGRGRSVETSLMAGALLYHPKVIGERLDRHVFQTHPSGSAPFYSVYECGDGKWVQLGCVHVGFIATAAKLMGIGDLVAEPRFNGGGAPATPEDDAELRGVLTRVIATKPLAEWVEAFEAADVPFAPARQTEDGMTDPQVIHNEMVQTLDDPDLGLVVQMGVPLVFSETPGEVQGPRAAANNDGISLAAIKADAPPADGLDPPPLAGVRILEITNLIAGPTGGRLLADLGADVIKFEPLGGDLSRPIGRTYFYNLNFNKRSVSVDTSTDAGKEVVQRIAASSDALLANLRPGATERMGIGPAINPQLIETHLTGYGRTGPYAHRPGIDPLAQAMMGMSWAQGGPENQPVFPAQLAPTDYTTGALGAWGTVLALYARKRHGIVQRVDSNLLNGAVLLSSAWFSDYEGRPRRPLADKDQYGLNPFHRLFRLADGWVYVAADTEAQRRTLCRIAGKDEGDASQPDAEEGRHPNQTALAQALAEAFAGRGLAELRAELHEAGIPSAEAQSGDSELYLDDPHTHTNGMAATVQHPIVGDLAVACQYIHLGNTQVCDWKPTPLLGEHSDDALREVGYGEAEIRDLHDAGVVKREAP